MRLAEATEDVDVFAALINQRGLARLETGDLDGACSDLRTAMELHAQEGSLLRGL